MRLSRGSLSTLIDAFESIPKRKTTVIRAETRQSVLLTCLLHDNAWLYVAKPAKTYLETLQWQVLPHPPYSPDIAPSDFHLLRSMAHGLADQRFHSYKEAKNGSILG